MAGLERVPAIIRGTESPKRKLELALIENIQRSDLNPLESARAYARLQDEFGLTQKEVALRVGKSRESVTNTMRLLSLSPRIQSALEEGTINESQARHLLSIENPAEREEMFSRLLSGDVSVRKMRERITAAKNPDPESAGIDLTAVPFGGANEAKTALLGGHVTMIGLNVGEYSTSDQAAFRALAQFSDQRSVLAPDLPTAQEQGFEVLMSSERGLAARCDTPADIREKLAAAVDSALANPEFQEKAKQQALPLAYRSGVEWQADMPKRLARYTEIFKLIEGGQ